MARGALEGVLQVDPGSAILERLALTVLKAAWVSSFAERTISALVLTLPVPYHGHIENRGVEVVDAQVVGYPR